MDSYLHFRNHRKTESDPSYPRRLPGRRALPSLRSRNHRDIVMQILLANPRGFCAGVNMAIESLDLAIRAFGTPIYVYHEIVHNKYVVDTGVSAPGTVVLNAATTLGAANAAPVAATAAMARLTSAADA